MQKPLKKFRDRYRESLLTFLWREWTALGVAGTATKAGGHAVDPEALLLFTCSIARHDQRLFDEVMDWLLTNGRYINIQRLRNIMAREDFRGGAVLSAVADWLAARGASSKWRLLALQPEGSKPMATALRVRAKTARAMSSPESPNRVREEPVPASEYSSSARTPLFFLHDGRPMPPSRDTDPMFLRQGFQRSLLQPRGYAMPFNSNVDAAQLLKLRALFGVNARCEILDYLARQGSGYPRAMSRELYYSQKSIHDTLADLECAGIVESTRSTRERNYHLIPGELAALDKAAEAGPWLNWPLLLSRAEQVWLLVNDSLDADREVRVIESELNMALEPVLQRLFQSSWSLRVKPSENYDFMERLEAIRGCIDAAGSGRD